MSVKLISITPDAEKTIAFIARVSSPNQENPEYDKLLRYCLKHGHWSVFEHGHMTLEITTSRMISQQIVRHRSFTFSEFSQRYARVQNYVCYEARRQDEKNRQNSIDDLDEDTKDWWQEAQLSAWHTALKTYEAAIHQGVAKECARAVLPLSTETKLYMTGSIRSWIHYIGLRANADTQLEHRGIAEQCKTVFKEQLPVVSSALDW